MRLRTVAHSTLLLLAVASVVNAAQPNGASIMDAVKRRTDAVRDYQADITMTVKGPQVNIKDMVFRLYYKKPNKVHMEARQGVAVVPGGTFFLNPVSELVRSAKPIYLKAEKRHGIDCHVVKLVPTGASPGAPETKLWVDKKRSLVLATESTGDFGAKTSWRYAAVEGKYYLPSVVTAELRAPGQSGVAGRSIKASLRFTDYQVNKGISDKVFSQQSRDRNAKP